MFGKTSAANFNTSTSTIHTDIQHLYIANCTLYLIKHLTLLFHRSNSTVLCPLSNTHQPNLYHPKYVQDLPFVETVIFNSHTGIPLKPLLQIQHRHSCTYPSHPLLISLNTAHPFATCLAFKHCPLSKQLPTKRFTHFPSIILTTYLTTDYP